MKSAQETLPEPRPGCCLQVKEKTHFLHSRHDGSKWRVQSPIKEIIQSVGPEGKEQEMLIDEVTVEMSENLTGEDLGGMKGGILGKGNKVRGRKAPGREGRKFSLARRLYTG